MLLSMPSSSTAVVAPAPTTRTEAAQAITGLPIAIAMSAMMTAMPRIPAGQTASRADLVAPILAKLSPEAAGEFMLGAIEGSLNLAPELAERGESLRQAAQGVANLLAECAADTQQQDAKTALAGVTGPLGSFTDTLVDAAKVLDPNFSAPQPSRP